MGTSITFAAWRANSNSIKKYDVIHDLMTYSFHFRLPLVHRYQGNVLSYFLFHFTDHSTLKKRFNNQFSLHFLYINFFYWSFWRTFFSLDTKKLFSNRRLDYFYFPVFVFVFSPLPKINTDCNCALHRNTLWLKIKIIQTTDEKSTIKYKNIFQAYLIGPTNT